MAQPAKIRVGIIRCDPHGYWYSLLFDKCDPDIMIKNQPGCHYYFYRQDDPRKLRKGVVPGFSIAKVYDDQGQGLAEGLSEAFYGKPKVCKTFEEVSDDVDLVYIADCNFEGQDHLKLAAPGIKKGVPHIIDKPFAYTLEDAHAIVDLANRHKTPVMCSSLLRQSPYLERFRNRLADIAPVGCLTVPCGGPSLASVFHGLSIVQAILGEGCEWVESMGPDLFDFVRLHYPGPSEGTEAIVFNMCGSLESYPPLCPGMSGIPSEFQHCGYTASAYGAGGAVHSPRIDDYLFLDGGVRIVNMAKRMVRTGKPPIPYASMLELVEIVEAARLAHNKGVKVVLKDLR